jgi:hypothetical protein
MTNRIENVYQNIYDHALKIIGWFFDIKEGCPFEVVMGIGSLVGIIVSEYLYFSAPGEQRLLYAILIVFPGAAIGGICSAILYFSIAYLVAGLIILFLALITLGPIAALIYLVVYFFYSIKI